jgi:hypothetical protein
MSSYAFMNPILPGRTAAWKACVNEMAGPKAEALKASRRRAGLTKEEVFLQHTPAGDFAVVYWEAPDIGKVFQTFMTSQDPFDAWFRDKVLVEVHGMNPKAPPPPMNEHILGL